ncbi:MAG: NhaA family Na+:H+ antiporter [Myxococcota bacterium]|jgi:NhaA family Na+:H+ antiporter
MSENSEKKGFTNFLQEFSIPLIAGVIAGLVAANIDEHMYHQVVDFPILGEGASIFGHKLTFHFLVNDIFMVLFFGVAAKEITESVLPGGDLNPPSKAINPLLGTLGGVVGPVGVYLLLAWIFFDGHPDAAAVYNGWGVPTATDIALAWLVARLIFGKGHPAVNFLLLLAVADDAIGLGIIAVFYPNPDHPVAPIYLLVTLAGMGTAYALRRAKVNSWVPYVAVAGGLSWVGLILASLHPALALVAIVPFMPAGDHEDTGLFDEGTSEHFADSPLHNFEHDVKLVVDFGLFFFAFANAGVGFTSINAVTWIILASLIIGKTLGITLFSGLGAKLGFPLPTGMGMKHLIASGVVAGLGLTVALFVAGEAFPGDSAYQGPAKMGAVLSGGAALLAFGLGKIWDLKGKA